MTDPHTTTDENDPPEADGPDVPNEPIDPDAEPEED